MASPVSDLTEGPSDPKTGESFDGAAWEPRLQDGELFGPYRIERVLGRGGMGEVYEAEHLEHGRRVALKVLNERLRRADDRVRFLGEGQLAASIDHPNSVYVFTCEEIAGIPVIAMELLRAGTLKDRVRSGGPLPAVDAVDAILQVIAGLEAANTAGIFHRDVKPSNCFIDHRGIVKIGDFGLSISALGRGAAPIGSSGSFQGTPEFAAPEQLRGETLDVRADIYSVGATLYYLLTGRPAWEPIDRSGTAAQVASSRTGALPSLPSNVPAELAARVRQCLASDRDDRPASYADLADTLRPFSSTVRRPARVGARLAALAFDAVVLVGIGAIFMAALVGSGRLSDPRVALLLAMALPAALYWAVCEGGWGTSYGKHACGLQVVANAGQRPGFARGSVRSLVFVVPLALAAFISNWLSSHLITSSFPTEGLTVALAGGLVCSTMRRRNGFAGLHDLTSGTRVIERPTVTSFPAIVPPAVEPFARAHETRIGPYEIIEGLGPTDTGESFLGFDSLLKRRVWIHVVPTGAPPVPSAIRDANRPGHLHWLNGTRTPFGGWDAFEALDGVSLTSKVARPWREVRQWLLDLAKELDVRFRDGTLDSLNLDRVWITPDGHAKLLDFRAPGVTADAIGVGLAPSLSAQSFLGEVARRSLIHRPTPPLPLSATTFLRSLERGEFSDLSNLIPALAELVACPDHLTVRHRGRALALCMLAMYFGAQIVGRALAADPCARNLAMRFSLTYRDLGEVGCVLLGVLWALLLRSGFWLRAFDVAVVMPDGREASPWRAAARALVVWSWVPAQLVTAAFGWVPATLAIGLAKIVGIAWAADSPNRGPQDLITGTYLVPR